MNAKLSNDAADTYNLLEIMESNIWKAVFVGQRETIKNYK